MAGLTAAEFGQKALEVCSRSKIVTRVLLISGSKRHVRLRILLSNLSFVDVYYNQKSGKTAFAQVQKSDRIFGADNTHGFWHWHPREDPASHVAAKSEISFEEFMAKVEADVK